MTGFRETTPERGVYFPVRDTLIRAHQYLIAKYDVDGFRIDTLKYIEPEFARFFGNAIREYAQSIGKKNFFTFGEVYDDEAKIARFIGRNALESGDLIGVDAALDFPLFYNLPGVAKGQLPPSSISRRVRATPADPARDRQLARRGEPLLRDLPGQPRPAQALLLPAIPADPERYDDQATLGLGCLFTLQGIPCVYYGTEQGLHGAGGSPRRCARRYGASRTPSTGAIRSSRRCAGLRGARRSTRAALRPPVFPADLGRRRALRPVAIPQRGAGVLAHPQRQEVLVVANTDAGSLGAAM